MTQSIHTIVVDDKNETRIAIGRRRRCRQSDRFGLFSDGNE